MKKFYFVVIFIVVALSLQAKTTYIPTYYNRILAIESSQMDSLLNFQPILHLDSKDKSVSYTIVHQAVSPELVKAIKQAKRAAGWASAASFLAIGGSTFSEVQLIRGGSGGYVVGAMEGQYASNGLAATSAQAYAQAEDLKDLMVDLIVTNHSEKEMQITDMDRGLIWYVLPKKEIALSLLKGEECHFRISPSSPSDENVKYINVLTDSYLEKYSLALETEMFWYVPISEKTKNSLNFDSPMENGYIKIDKETLKMSEVTPNDFKAIKASYRK